MIFFALLALGSAGAGTSLSAWASVPIGGEPETSRAPCESLVPTSARSLAVRTRQLGTSARPGPLRQSLIESGFTVGAPIFFRIFKQTPEESRGVLEAWIQKTQGAQRAGVFELFKSYPILAWSGSLGPKLKEGDRQSPEGFYFVKAAQLNPYSSVHLSMNIGFPNEYDRSLGRTGSEIMIHGSDQSVGCYAIGDAMIEEVYLLAEAALLDCVKEIPIAAFPFRLTSENLRAAASSPWHEFWGNLAEGYGFFETYHLPPEVRAEGGRYHFSAP